MSRVPGKASLARLLTGRAPLATTVVTVILLGAAHVGRGAENPPAESAALGNLSLLDVHGVPHRLGARADRQAAVFVFLFTECPIANGYIPELNRIYRESQRSKAGVDFYGVVSDRSTTFSAAAKHSGEFQIEFPVLFDASGDLAQALSPTHVPEAFVFDRADRLAYRGRIDDTYADLGKRRPQATTHDLRDAVQAVIHGRAVAASRTQPIGCLLETKRVLPTTDKVTYTRDIAPILQANCMNCHREGEVAPFALTSYDDAAKRAALLAEVVDSRLMPPWRPEPGFGHLLGERRLTDSQIALFQTWLAAGTPAGNPADLPVPPKFVDGWQLGEPDLVVKMPESFDVPADGRDVFRNFVIPLDVSEDKLVAAVEFRPGNHRVVHHALYFLDVSGQARKKDEADPGLGYSTFGGPGFLPSGALGGWAPGQVSHPLPDGMGRLLRKGSDLVLQIHYHPSGKSERDQSTIGIHFVKRPSDKIVAGLIVADRNLYIPAGEARHAMNGSYTLPADVTLVGLAPHMHLLGREMKATATRPDGTTEPLIWIRDWNFNWQDQYLFAQPMRLPKGTRLDVEAYYDNSAANPLNPNSPPQPVTWGEQTTDEMFICFFLAMADTPRELVPLIMDNLASVARKGRVGGRRVLPEQ